MKAFESSKSLKCRNNCIFPLFQHLVVANGKRGRSLALCSFLILSLVSIIVHPTTGFAGEFFPYGNFETGNSHVLVLGFPGYESPGSSQLETTRPVSGRMSLRLFAKQKGGYILGTTAIPVERGRAYTASVTIESAGAVNVRIEVFGNGKNGLGLIKSSSKRFQKGRHIARLPFSKSSWDSKRQEYVNESIWVRVTLSGRSDMLVDNLSLTGPGKGLSGNEVTLSHKKSFGVNRVGDKDKMAVFVPPGESGNIQYEIADYFGKVVDSGVVAVFDYNPASPAFIDLPCQKRGHFTVRVSFVSSTPSNLSVKTHRSYSVIVGELGERKGEPRFGLTTAEYTYTPQLPAGTSLDDYFDLFQDMGAGSVRLFCVDDPNLVSRDGSKYDFSAMDLMAEQIDKRNMSAFIPLGPFYPDMTPEWMRTASPDGNVSLMHGLRTEYLKKRAKKRLKGTPYLDLGKYQAYLRKVMSRLNGSDVDYEMWNEPGHKFSHGDVAKLTHAARMARDSVAPRARIIGFSSTKGPGSGQGARKDHIPVFFESMLSDAGNDIDIASYHSGHAYAYLGKEFDRRNMDTGYPLRLRAGLKLYGMSDKPVWDTERASPWHSVSVLLDTDTKTQGIGQEIALDIDRCTSPEELAIRLPMIYAAGFRDGVERIYWFNAVVGKSYSNYILNRWSLWDFMVEPTPMIPSYAAMTELLEGTTVNQKRYGVENGGRGYLFTAPHKTVFLCYNWKENQNSISVSRDGGIIQVFDLMGNLVKKFDGIDSVNITVGKHPVYIVGEGGHSLEFNFIN